MLPFNELAAEKFERLCFALLRASPEFADVRLSGTGGPQFGADIRAKHVPSDGSEPKVWSFECKRRLHFKPRDLENAVRSMLKACHSDLPQRWVLLLSRKKTAYLENKARELEGRDLLGNGAAVPEIDIWDQAELSERLRKKPLVVSSYFGEEICDHFCRTEIWDADSLSARLRRRTSNSLDQLKKAEPELESIYLERFADDTLNSWMKQGARGFNAIVGQAGTGKTCMLARAARRFLTKEDLCVIFMRCENIDQQGFEATLKSPLSRGAARMTLTELIAQIGNEGPVGLRTVVFLDTLDILPRNLYPKLYEFVLAVTETDGLVVASCRPDEFNLIEQVVPVARDGRIDLDILSPDETERLFTSYKRFYSSREARQADFEHFNLNPNLSEVCRSPLLMRILFEVYDPIVEQHEMTENFLYGRLWLLKVSTGRKERKNIDIELLGDAKRLATGRLSLSMLDAKKIVIPETRFVETIISESCHERHVIEAAIHDLRGDGILRPMEDMLEFFHQTFFEYAAARFLLNDPELESKFQNSVREDPDPFYLPIIRRAALLRQAKK